MEQSTTQQNQKNIDQISFQTYLSQIRLKLNPQTNSPQQISKLIQLLLNEQLQKIHQTSFQIITLRIQNKLQKKQTKILLFYFQLLNLILINLNNQKNYHKINLNTISKNIQIYTNHPNLFYQKTFKSLLIFYFNLLKKINLNVQPFIQQKIQSRQLILNQLFQIFNSILSCYFISHSKNSSKSQTSFKQQTQWIGYIMQYLPEFQFKKIDETCSNSFIKNYFDYLEKANLKQTSQSISFEKKELNLISEKQQKRQLNNKKSQYQFLHMIANFLNLVIQSRTTTQLIKNYPCEIQDIQYMYSKSNQNKLCHFKLNIQDLQFLIQLFIKYYFIEKQYFISLFKNKQNTLKLAYQVPQEWILKTQEQIQIDQNARQKLVHQGHITIGQLLLETMNILNYIIFLGGYNHKLQEIVFQPLFYENILPSFLQLAFLLYSQKRFLGKNNPKVILAKPPDANLSKILEMDYQSFSKAQKQAILKLIAQEIKFGQLSTLLRLLTNLIHINKQALTYFQNNVKYLHMVMSLTHESQMNLTMKNWAVLFIKNCCDSQKLRQQISKIKIQMKIDK